MWGLVWLCAGAGSVCVLERHMEAGRLKISSHASADKNQGRGTTGLRGDLTGDSDLIYGYIWWIILNLGLKRQLELSIFSI